MPNIGSATLTIPKDGFAQARERSIERGRSAVGDTAVKLEELCKAQMEMITALQRQVGALQGDVAILTASLNQERAANQSARRASEEVICTLRERVAVLEIDAKSSQIKVDKLLTHTHAFRTNSGLWGNTNAPTPN